MNVQRLPKVGGTVKTFIARLGAVQIIIKIAED